MKTLRHSPAMIINNPMYKFLRTLSARVRHPPRTGAVAKFLNAETGLLHVGFWERWFHTWLPGAGNPCEAFFTFLLLRGCLL